MRPSAWARLSDAPTSEDRRRERKIQRRARKKRRGRYVGLGEAQENKQIPRQKQPSE